MIGPTDYIITRCPPRHGKISWHFLDYWVVVTNMIFNSITDAHDAITHWHIPKCEVSNINSFLLQDVSLKPCWLLVNFHKSAWQLLNSRHFQAFQTSRHLYNNNDDDKSDNTHTARVLANTCSLYNKLLVTKLHSIQPSTSLHHMSNTHLSIVHVAWARHKIWLFTYMNIENLYSPSKHGRQQTISNTNTINQ